eukprot:361251-Chlamydomonas_euryale.AAC.11
MPAAPTRQSSSARTLASTSASVTRSGGRSRLASSPGSTSSASSTESCVPPIVLRHACAARGGGGKGASSSFSLWRASRFVCAAGLGCDQGACPARCHGEVKGEKLHTRKMTRKIKDEKNRSGCLPLPSPCTSRIRPHVAAVLPPSVHPSPDRALRAHHDRTFVPQ